MRFKIQDVGRLSLCLIMGTVISACAPVKSNSEYYGNSAHQAAYLKPDIAGFLSASMPGSAAVFAQSPWGGNVSVIAGSAYFAASSASCRQLIVSKDGNPFDVLACTNDQKQWYQVRLLTSDKQQ